MREWLLPLVIGTATGVLSAWGIGGGSLLLVYLTTWAGFTQTQGQGINLLYFLPAAAMALPTHYRQGNLHTPTLLPAILAGLVTTALGAWLANALPLSALRRGYALFLLVVGGRELFAPRPSPQGEEEG